MEIRVIEYFIALTREHTISAAAKSLSLTQPTLTRQLKALEEKLGVELFIRGKKSIKLAEEGLLFKKRALEILDLVDKTKEEITYQDNEISGKIVIGTCESVSLKQILLEAKEFNKKYPGVHFEVISADEDETLSKLDKGLIDCALYLGDVNKIEYNYYALEHADKWGVLVSRGDPLSNKSEIELKDIEEKPLIVSEGPYKNGELDKIFNNKSVML